MRSGAFLSQFMNPMLQFILKMQRSLYWMFAIIVVKNRRSLVNTNILYICSVGTNIAKWKFLKMEIQIERNQVYYSSHQQMFPFLQIKLAEN